MEPHIDAFRFGVITISGQATKHDVIIDLRGTVKKRRKELSKQVYGTSHNVSLAEAQATWEEGTETLIVGTGLLDRVRLSAEARAYLAERGCAVELRPTRRAIRLWNDSQGSVIALFHISC